MDSDFLINRITGVFFGLGIGDALGKPVTGLSPFEIMSRYQTVDAFYGHKHDKPGQYSHIARDAFYIARSIYENGTINIDDLTQKITTKEAEFQPDFLPRVVPVAAHLCFNPVDDTTILKTCRDVVMITQKQKISVLPAFIIAKIIVDCIRNRKALDNPSDLYQSDKSLLARIIETLQQAEKRLEIKPKILFSDRIMFTRKKLQARISIEEFLGMNGNRETDECAAFSLFCFMKSPDSFNSVIAAASMGGNASVNACLVGSMVGAYTGPICFAQDFKDNVENSSKILSWGEDFVGKFYKGE